MNYLGVRKSPTAASALARMLNLCGAEVVEIARCGQWIKHASGWTFAESDGTSIVSVTRICVCVVSDCVDNARLTRATPARAGCAARLQEAFWCCFLLQFSLREAQLCSHRAPKSLKPGDAAIGYSTLQDGVR